MNLYESNEIDMHPEFQRFFRWSPEQKSRFIESILIGIPLPSIFVSQREDGIWDLVDGLQRLSTIFQFAGLLRGEDGALFEKLKLADTRYDYLPSLAGMMWDDEAGEGIPCLTPAQRLYIKRSKLDVKIVLKQSDPRARLDLFQRLNTGGSSLSFQELRNCLLIMADREFYRWLRALADYQPFVNCLSITDRAYDEQYDVELALRFVVFRTLDEAELRTIGDLNLFLDSRSVELASSSAFDRAAEAQVFKSVFDLLAQATGGDSFRRFREGKGFAGGFLASAFEAIAIGLGYNHGLIGKGVSPDTITERIHQLWLLPEFAEEFAAGQRASSRIPRTIPLGRKFFGAL